MDNEAASQLLVGDLVQRWLFLGSFGGLVSPMEQMLDT